MTPGRFDLRSLAFSRFLAILPLAPAVRADLIYQLTDDGCSGGCGPQVSFGQVDLHTVTATEVEVTVTLFNGNEFVMTGNHEGLTFNVDDGTATVVPVTTGFTNTTSTDNPPLGTFGYALSCTGWGLGASNPLPGPFVVDITRASGLAPGDFIAKQQWIQARFLLVKQTHVARDLDSAFVARAAHFFQRTIHHLPDRPQRMIRQNPFLHRTVTEQLILLLVFSAHTTDDVRNISYVTSLSTSTSLGSRTTAFYL